MKRATAVAAMAAVLVGYDMGVISGALLFIKPEFRLSPLESGFVVTTLLVGAVVGAAVAGSVAQAIGRRTTLLITCLVYVVSSVVMAVAPGYGWLLVGRALAGVAVGSTQSTVPTYLAELAPTDTRGRQSTGNQLMIATGILISAVVNYFFARDLSWRWSLGLAAVPAALIGLALLRQSETPRWLMLKGRVDEARRVLDALLPADQAQRAFGELDAARRADVGGDTGNASLTWRSLLRSRALRRILVVATIFSMAQQLLGINSIVYYAPTILAQVGFGTTAALINTIGFGVLSVVMTLLCGYVVDRTGRRPLLIAGAVVLGVAMLGVAAVFGFHLLGTFAGQSAVLAMLSIFKAGYSLTWGPVVWIMLPELFPLRARSAGVSVATSAQILVTVALTLFFPDLIAHGATGIFVFFGLFGLAAAVFAAKLLPETTRQSLESLHLPALRRSS
ncbi:sugar porter family MFS transporter [Amycolatopsis saalfeldensis]|uniref:MFS transporter, sugar porter (SP) family n=1 Tax=Amycolatopsis saalfeldensis TaxID=394193 RepID=A0A1H8RNF7_9PSEU|nr:sugar porter family MFS transporter [Amycolatopsis saalfeldensis]SEO67905.1 MFS transporter, sugar porter (SP) family [Amycolatopsis saalfeldensis]